MNNEKKYLMLVFEETTDKPLEFFSDNPYRGRLSDVVYGNNVNDLRKSSDGYSNEGLFYVLYSTMSRSMGTMVGYGMVDFSAIDKEIRYFESLKKTISDAGIDQIEDDETFCTTENAFIYDWCVKNEFDITEDDLQEIRCRGLKDAYADWRYSYYEERKPQKITDLSPDDIDNITFSDDETSGTANCASEQMVDYVNCVRAMQGYTDLLKEKINNDVYYVFTIMFDMKKPYGTQLIAECVHGKMDDNCFYPLPLSDELRDKINEIIKKAN